MAPSHIIHDFIFSNFIFSLVSDYYLVFLFMPDLMTTTTKALQNCRTIKGKQRHPLKQRHLCGGVSPPCLDSNPDRPSPLASEDQSGQASVVHGVEAPFNTTDAFVLKDATGASDCNSCVCCTSHFTWNNSSSCSEQ